jgi:hypothetical protein
MKEFKKRKFDILERYAIWKFNEERCWLCTEPLLFKEVTIDHFFPENLLLDKPLRDTVLGEYGLNDELFQINGFENWLPSHHKCNEKKSTEPPKFIPGNVIVISKLIQKSEKVKKTVLKLKKTSQNSKVFARLLYALENQKITTEDLADFINPHLNNEKIEILPQDLILLNNGYWVYKNEIAREGLCTCERPYCVGSNQKVYCYFPPSLSSWVVNKGLYFKCYDEIINCPRCQQNHKRGHIGKKGICRIPYNNQDKQQD